MHQIFKVMQRSSVQPPASRDQSKGVVQKQAFALVSARDSRETACVSSPTVASQNCAFQPNFLITINSFSVHLTLQLTTQTSLQHFVLHGINDFLFPFYLHSRTWKTKAPNDQSGKRKSVCTPLKSKKEQKAGGFLAGFFFAEAESMATKLISDDFFIHRKLQLLCWVHTVS